MTALQTLRLIFRTLSRALFAGPTPPSPRRRPPGTGASLSPGHPIPFVGKTYVVRLVETMGRARVVEQGTELQFHLPPGTDQQKIQRLLQQWYRKKFKALVPGLLARWEPVVGVHAEAWGVKQMKTRWGTCNPRDKRIWLNLELAKKNQDAVEYVLVHELVHLLEPSHNARFKALMTRFYPRWKDVRRSLDPVAPTC